MTVKVRNLLPGLAESFKFFNVPKRTIKDRLIRIFTGKYPEPKTLKITSPNNVAWIREALMNPEAYLTYEQALRSIHRQPEHEAEEESEKESEETDEEADDESSEENSDNEDDDVS